MIIDDQRARGAVWASRRAGESASLRSPELLPRKGLDYFDILEDYVSALYFSR